MKTNTVSSLAILTANWHINKRDYIENFVPFIATLIKHENYEEIEIGVIRDDFKNKYGLSIPFHPMQTILTRCKKRGLIRKQYRKHVPDLGKVSEYEFSNEAKNQFRKQEKVIKEIIKYASDRYKYDISEERIEHAFISFLKEYSLDILFAADDRGLLPEVSSTKSDKYIVYSFICHVYESEPDIFDFVVDIAIGNLMANSILYREYNRYVSNLDKVCFYLDTRIVFRLLGLEGDERAEVYDEFIKTLVNEGACIKIFRHTYEEVCEILEECLNWVENPAYNPIKANAALRYFIGRNYSKLDVQRFINKIDQTLNENSIAPENIVIKPDKQDKSKYLEDEKLLGETIVTTYKETNPYFDEVDRETTLRRDIDSVISVYILREGKNPRHLKDSGHLFLTTNGALAYAARKYELRRTENKNQIPACLTDIFVGTILWLQSPAKIYKINQRKLIADCYSALRPDNRLIKKYLLEVDKFKEEGKIDENSYYLLRRDSLALKLLEEKTLGEADSFDGSILTEIYYEIKEEMTEKVGLKYVAERDEHRKTQQKYDELTGKHHKITSNLHKEARRCSQLVSNIVLFGILAAFLLGIIYQIIPTAFSETPEIKYGVIIFYVILGSLNIIYGFNLFGLKKYLQKYLEKLFTTFLIGN